jgi:hypothetical protein
MPRATHGWKREGPRMLRLTHGWKREEKREVPRMEEGHLLDQWSGMNHERIDL